MVCALKKTDKIKLSLITDFIVVPPLDLLARASYPHQRYHIEEAICFVVRAAIGFAQCSIAPGKVAATGGVVGGGRCGPLTQIFTSLLEYDR